MNDQELRALAVRQEIDLVTLQHEEREVQMLARIADDPVLALALAFKGGTALRLVYLCDRYSDDLDFDIVRTIASPREILRRLEQIARDQTLEITDSWVKRRTVLLEVRETGWKRKLKIEVSSLPRSMEVRTVVKNIVTPVFPASVNILTYSLETLLAGKMLAVLLRRPRTPRDLYDLFWLLSRGITEDRTYLKSAGGKNIPAKRGELYVMLREAIEDYDDRHISSELGALLPRTQRTWATASLKERTKELLHLRISAGV